MEFVSRVGDIIMMDNGTSVIVIDCIEYMGEAYLKIATITDKEPGYIEGFAKEIVSEDGTYDLDVVKNLETKKALSDIIEECSKIEISEDAE